MTGKELDAVAPASSASAPQADPPAANAAVRDRVGPLPDDGTPKEDQEFTRFKEGTAADGEKREPAWLRGEFPGQIGPFRLDKRIKEGGMGVVYLASQSKPIERRVAIKFIKRTIDSPEARLRLEVECRSLAKFNHPNIAGFIDCGFYERIPFILMEFIDGKGILEYCHHPRSEPNGQRAPRPELRRRLEIFLQACDGLRHAHQRGVIHRDISATNVMVTEIDGKPTAKLIDFGLSVFKEQGGDESHDDPPRPGKESPLMGTAAYMSPEQLRGPHHTVDFRADVYSMGVLLFELITGERPYAVTTEQDALATYDSLAKPIAPSTKVDDVTRKLTSSDTVDWSRLRELRRLQKALRGDLDAIVVKAMEINPEKRYGSIRDLADDLRAYLDGRPLLVARPAGPVVRVRKFLRRNWAACMAAALAVVFLVATATISTSAAIKEAGLNDELRKANVDLGERKRVAEAKQLALDQTYKRLRGAQANSYAAQIRAVPDLLTRGEITSARQLLLGTALSGESKVIARSWEWNHLLARIEASEMVFGLSRRGFTDVLDAGTRICGVAGDGSVWFWDARTGAFVRTNKLHKDAVIAAWANPEQTYCQTLDASGLIIRWAVADGKRQDQVQLPAGVGDLSDAVAVFSPDGTQLCLYRPGEKELLLVPTEPGRKGEPITPIPIPPNSKNLRLSWAKESLACVARVAGKLRLLEWKGELKGKVPPPEDSAHPIPELGLPLTLTHAGGRFLLRYPSGGLLFRGPARPNGDIDIRMVTAFDCPGDWLACASLSADGNRVVTGGTADDRAVRIWNAETGAFEGQYTGNPDDLGVRLGHDKEITKVIFKGDAILSASADGTIRKWDARAPRYARQLLPAVAGKRAVRQGSDMSWLRFVKKDSELITVFSRAPYVVFWDTKKGTPEFRLSDDQAAELLPEGYELVFAGAGASADSTRMAFVRRHATLKNYDLVVGNFKHGKATLKRVWGITSGGVRDLAVSNNGQMIALSTVEEKDHPAGRLLLWQWGNDEPSGDGEVLPDSAGCLDGLTFDANAAYLAGCGKGLRVWNLQGERTSRFFSISDGDLGSPAFSPNGKRIAAGVSKPLDGGLVEPAGLVLVNLETRETVQFGRQEASIVHGIAWDPPGVRIATAEHDVVRIWSTAEEYRLMLTLRDPPAFVDCIDWSGDSEWVAAGCPAAGAAYLFCGPVQQDREGHFLLRELQRAHPIREHLEAYWRSMPEHLRFEEQFKQFLRFNGDDPGTIAEWAWRYLMPVDAPDLVTDDGRGERGDKAWLNRWLPCRAAVARAARNWDEDAEIQLLLGIAQYRCKEWSAAVGTLKNIAPQSRKPGEPSPLSSGGENDLAVIGKLYLAMAYRKNGQQEDARRHLEEACQLLGKRGPAKQGIATHLGEGVIHRAGAALELARKEAQAVFPEKAIGE